MDICVDTVSMFTLVFTDREKEREKKNILD